MNFTNALIEKAKTAKSAEELLAMAKAENIDMTAEKAAKSNPSQRRSVPAGRSNDSIYGRGRGKPRKTLPVAPIA